MAARVIFEKKWQRVAAYGVFALLAFALCLVLTFPYDAIRARVVMEAAAQGYAVRIGSLRPGLRGLTATDLRISKPPAPLLAESVSTLASGDARAIGLLSPAELGEALQIRSVALRPSLFPLGVAFHANAFDGSISGAVGGLGSLAADVELSGLKAGTGNLKGFTGMDLEGTLQGELTLRVPKSTGATTAGFDYSKANGQVQLAGSGLVIKGGTVMVPMSGTPTPMDLPRIVVGELKANLNVVEGLGTLEELQGKSEDLELRGQGTLKLARRFEYSEPAMEFRIKAEPEFIKRLGLIGAGLSILPPDRKDPGFRVAKLSGLLGRPKFGPGAR